MHVFTTFIQTKRHVGKQTTDVIYLLYIKLLTLSINAGKHLKLNMLLIKS